MALSKLRAELAEILPDKGISEINEFQVKIIDAVKAGKNILGTGPEGSGKQQQFYYPYFKKSLNQEKDHHELL